MTLPNPKAVRDLFNDLLGREVTLAPADAWAPALGDEACIATMTDDAAQVQAVALLDLPLTVFLGASLGLVPGPMAAEMIADKAPSEAVMANVHEVLNVLTAVVNGPGNPHVRLGSVYANDASVPHPIRELLAHVSGRADFALTIDGYGTGQLGLITY